MKIWIGAAMMAATLSFGPLAAVPAAAAPQAGQKAPVITGKTATDISARRRHHHRHHARHRHVRRSFAYYAPGYGRVYRPHYRRAYYGYRPAYYGYRPAFVGGPFYRPLYRPYYRPYAGFYRPAWGGPYGYRPYGYRPYGYGYRPFGVGLGPISIGFGFGRW